MHDYLYDISLPVAYIQQLKDWVDQGAEAGDPSDVGPELKVDKGQIESIDAVATMEAPYHPITKDSDDYRCFSPRWCSKLFMNRFEYFIESGESTADEMCTSAMFIAEP